MGGHWGAHFSLGAPPLPRRTAHALQWLKASQPRILFIPSTVIKIAPNPNTPYGSLCVLLITGKSVVTHNHISRVANRRRPTVLIIALIYLLT